MKKIYIILIMALLFSCDEEIKKSDNIEIVILENDQELTDSNINDFSQFQEKKSFTVNEFKEELIESFSNSKNYMKGGAKMCKFTPKFSVKVNGEVYAILSNEDCEQMLYNNNKKDNNSYKIVDINPSNTVYLSIKKILKDNYYEN